MKVKMFGETYIRKDGACPCNSDTWTCNFCVFELVDKNKHVHIFYYVKTLIKKNFIRRLFGKELKTYMYKCPCGETRQYGPKIELWDDWDMMYV